MAGSLYARARFMAGFVLRMASRALPTRTAPAASDDEALIEALMTGDLARLSVNRQRLLTTATVTGSSWFFVALECGSLPAIRWFLSQGANASAPDASGRLPLEALIQRAALADEFDDHLPDCPAMAQVLIVQGADPDARTIRGVTLFELAAAAGIDLTPRSDKT